MYVRNRDYIVERYFVYPEGIVNEAELRNDNILKIRHNLKERYLKNMNLEPLKNKPEQEPLRKKIS